MGGYEVWTPVYTEPLLSLIHIFGLEIDALLKDHRNTLKNIENYQRYLGSREQMDALFIADLAAIKREYATERRTALEDGREAVYVEAVSYTHLSAVCRACFLLWGMRSERSLCS